MGVGGVGGGYGGVEVRAADSFLWFEGKVQAVNFTMVEAAAAAAGGPTSARSSKTALAYDVAFDEVRSEDEETTSDGGRRSRRTVHVCVLCAIARVRASMCAHANRHARARRHAPRIGAYRGASRRGRIKGRALPSRLGARTSIPSDDRAV